MPLVIHPEYFVESRLTCNLSIDPADEFTHDRLRVAVAAGHDGQQECAVIVSWLGSRNAARSSSSRFWNTASGEISYKVLTSFCQKWIFLTVAC